MKQRWNHMNNKIWSLGALVTHWAPVLETWNYGITLKSLQNFKHWSYFFIWRNINWKRYLIFYSWESDISSVGHGSCWKNEIRKASCVHVGCQQSVTIANLKKKRKKTDGIPMNTKESEMYVVNGNIYSLFFWNTLFTNKSHLVYILFIAAT